MIAMKPKLRVDENEMKSALDHGHYINFITLKTLGYNVNMEDINFGIQTLVNRKLFPLGRRPKAETGDFASAA